MDKKSKAVKPKPVSFKNHIRSIERMLRKDLPREIKEAQEKKLEELKKQQEGSQSSCCGASNIFVGQKDQNFREKKDRKKAKTVGETAACFNWSGSGSGCY